MKVLCVRGGLFRDLFLRGVTHPFIGHERRVGNGGLETQSLRGSAERVAPRPERPAAPLAR